PPGEVNASRGPVTSPPGVTRATPAVEAAPDNATAAPPPPVAAPKKPQKTARSQNRRRDDSTEDFERADGGFGRSYADDTPRSRRTARDNGDDDRPRRSLGRDGGAPPAGPLRPPGGDRAPVGGGLSPH